jgi:hypothetical protein
MAFSQVLPSASGGDAIRVLFLRRYGESWRIAALSVMVERAAMVLSLLVSVALLSPLMPATPALEHLPAVLWLMVLCAAAGLGVLLAADWLTARLPPWRILHFLAHLSRAARSAFKGRAGLELLILCLITHLNMALAYLWLVHALQLPLSLVQCFFYASVTTVISALPLSIGGWGIREGVLVTLFGGVGIASHGALAFSVTLGILVAAVGGVGILGLWLGAPRRTGSTVGWTTRS